MKKKKKKKLNTPGTEGNFLNMINFTYEKSTVNTLFSDQGLKGFHLDQRDKNAFCPH